MACKNGSFSQASNLSAPATRSTHDTTSPAHPIRLIALDLDGTLLHSNKTLSDRNINALREANRRGVEVVLASGRMTAAMETTATALGLDVFVISYNGAVVSGRRKDGRKRLYERPLDLAVARELLAFAKPRKYQVNYYLDELVYSETCPVREPMIEIYRQRTGSPFRFVEDLSICLNRAPDKLLFVVEPHLRAGIQEELRPQIGDRAVMVRTDPEYLEFLAPGVDKGSGLAHLEEILGVPLSQVMAMGDGENDIPLLQAAGWPVAVRNACAECHVVAKAVTDNDNDHDAVAEAVERWVLNK